MKKAWIVCSLIFSVNFCFSQISGRCIDSSGKPIPYVNIGIKNTIIGTVTGSNGDFLIDENELSENNTVVVSHIAYKTKSVNLLKKSVVEIIMEPSYYDLEEVKIGALKYEFTKKKRIGNNTLTEHVVTGFSSHNFGSEVGKFFKVNKGNKYKIEKVHFNIAELGYKTGTFRINFYKTFGDRNIETERCNNNDIIMEVSKTGDVDVDVKNENLVFENDFLVSIECINYIKNMPSVVNEHKAIYFSSNVFCGPMYLRANHVTKWVSSKQKYNPCLGIQLFVKY